MTSPDEQSRSSSEDEAESMRYAILGEDSSTDREKLEKYTGDVDWPYLKPAYDSGVLLYVDPSLSLSEVGEAFSNDDTEAVGRWKACGDLIQPGPPHAAWWEDSKTRFRALVVSPFVLIQMIE